MAAPTRRKKLDKVSDAAANLPSPKFYCCRCGRSYSRLNGSFPVSHSPMYRGTGYLPICSECVDDLYEGYKKELGNDRDAMRRICMKLDLYWNDSIYAMVERVSGVQSRVRTYIGKTNLLKYIDKTFDDTILEEEAASKDEFTKRVDDAVSEKLKCIEYGSAQELSRNCENSYDGGDEQTENSRKEIKQEDIEFWGPGYDFDFYGDLNRRWAGWTQGSDVTDPSERSLYKQICLLEATITRDSAQGKAIDKNVNALNTLLGSMNLKPAQKKDDADGELDKMTLGVGIQKWEFSRPLPETPKNMVDIRGTIKNITTWYLGHACKMVGLRNSYCKMYEDAMDRLRVSHPEYDEEDDDSILNDLFASEPRSSEGSGV